MELTNPITTLTGVTYDDLQAWKAALDNEIDSLGFHSKLFPYRAGIQRFRTALDQLAAAMRGIDDGRTYPYYDAHRMGFLYKDPRKRR